MSYWYIFSCGVIPENSLPKPVYHRYSPIFSPGSYEDFLLSLLLFSHSVLSDSLRPHRLQHSRFPCPSPSPGVCSHSCPLSRWCHPTISSSVSGLYLQEESIAPSSDCNIQWRIQSLVKALRVPRFGPISLVWNDLTTSTFELFEHVAPLHVGDVIMCKYDVMLILFNLAI